MTLQPAFASAARKLSKPRRLVRGAGAAIALLACVTAASAQRSEIYYNLSYAPGVPNTTVLTNVQDFVTITGPSAGWNYAGGGLGQPTGSTGVVTLGAQSGIGIAKVSATGRGAGYNAYVQGSWDDNLTFLGAPAGTVGTVSFQMSWDWTPSFGAAANGSGAVNPYVDLLLKPADQVGYANYQYGAVHQDFGQSCNALLQCIDSDSGIYTVSEERIASVSSQSGPLVTSANHLGTFAFKVEFGKTYNLMAAIGTDVSGANLVSSLDATHSLHWGGISSVVNSAGQAMNYTVSSASGFNYVSAVPEPNQTLLLLMGLSVVGFVARRRL